MSQDLSRRQFLEGLAALAGATLITGCNPPSGETGTAAPAAPVNAVANKDGAFVVPGAAALKAGEAQAFTFPNGEAGIVFVTSKGVRGALSARCTHSGCTVEWRPASGADELHCPCHDSIFEPNGEVRSGPAKRPLSRYSVTVLGQDAILKAA